MSTKNELPIKANATITVPVLPLRDVVVYPYMVIPLFVGRPKSIQALEAAAETYNNHILLTAQKNPADDEPVAKNIYEVGTYSRILQLIKLPDGTVKLLVEGIQRARIVNISTPESYLLADIELIQTQQNAGREVEVLARSVLTQFDQYIKLNKKIPPEILVSLAGIDDVNRLADTIAAHLTLKIPDKQIILEREDLQARLEHLLGLLDGELELLQVEKRIRGRVKRQMEKSQREYYLNEQMKAIQKELGELEDANPNELDTIAKKIEKAGMPQEAKEKATAELNKLKMMSPMSAEATVSRNYLEWVVNVTW